MPNVIPAALQAHYDTGQTCMAAAILIQRLDGEVFGFNMNSQRLVLDVTPWSSAPWDLSGMSAFEFDSAHGMEALSIQSTATLDVDDAALVVLNKGEVFKEPDILAGRWYGARYRLFLYRWDVTSPTIANDVETLKVGTFGEIHISPVTLNIELHCLKRRLQQPMGEVSQRTCRARFGSQGPGRCNIDIENYTFSLAVTSVQDALTFTCSAAVQAAGEFDQGTVTFTSGPNKGLTFSVESYESGGVFTLSGPAVLPVEVGNVINAVIGCRKRRDEDCHLRFANVVNFQGEPDRPTRDRIISGVGG